jgi:hypothetical protein
MVKLNSENKWKGKGSLKEEQFEKELEGIRKKKKLDEEFKKVFQSSAFLEFLRVS